MGFPIPKISLPSFLRPKSDPPPQPKPTPTPTPTPTPAPTAAPAAQPTPAPGPAPSAAPTPSPQPQPGYSGQSTFDPGTARAVIAGGQGNAGTATNGGTKGSFSKEIKGSKGFGLEFKSEVELKHEKREGAYTTVGFDGQVSVGVKWQAKSQTTGSGVGVSGAVGVKTSYEVKMKNEDYDRLKANGGLPVPNPYDPSTLPVGSQVRIDGKNFESSEFEAAFRNIKVKTGTEDWRGTSMAVEKTGEHTVKVTYGPTEGVEQTLSVGVGAAGFEASVGGKKGLEGAHLRTAEFDLSTEEGKAAYNDFITNGVIPEKGGPGVSGVAKIETVKLQQTTSGKVSGPGFEMEIPGGRNNGEATVTTFEDGSKAVKHTFETNAGEITIERHFNADGTEDKTKSKTSVGLPGTDPASASYLSTAFTGDEAGGQKIREAGGKQNAQVAFTSEQATQLQERAKAYLAANPGIENSTSPQMRFIVGLANSSEFGDPQLAVGAAFARADNPGVLGEALLELSYGTGGAPLPGEFKNARQ